MGTNTVVFNGGNTAGYNSGYAGTPNSYVGYNTVRVNAIASAHVQPVATTGVTLSGYAQTYYAPLNGHYVPYGTGTCNYSSAQGVPLNYYESLELKQRNEYLERQIEEYKQALIASRMPITSIGINLKKEEEPTPPKEKIVEVEKEQNLNIFHLSSKVLNWRAIEEYSENEFMEQTTENKNLVKIARALMQARKQGYIESKLKR